MNTVRTVSDTKREFYASHNRPIHSIYRRVVEELMVEMHLLSVNVDFAYDPMYALGVVSTFERFMQGYQPETDRNSIFNALCRATGGDPVNYQQDAAMVRQFAATLTNGEALMQSIQQPETISSGFQRLRNTLQSISQTQPFKYSRLFAIGLFNLLELVAPDVAADDLQRSEFFTTVSATLHLSAEKLKKDLELYRSNLEKITQAQLVMQDILNADRKQRDRRASGDIGVASDNPDQSASEAP